MHLSPWAARARLRERRGQVLGKVGPWQTPWRTPRYGSSHLGSGRCVSASQPPSPCSPCEESCLPLPSVQSAVFYPLALGQWVLRFSARGVGGGYLFRKMHWSLAPYSEPLIINPAPHRPSAEAAGGPPRALVLLLRCAEGGYR